MKFTKTQIELCGEMRSYKKCTNKEIRDYQDNIDNLFKSMQPIIDDIDELQDELEEYHDELKDIDDTIFTINSKEEPSDKERTEVLKLIKQKKAIRKNIRKNRKAIKKIDKDNTEASEKLRESIPKGLAKLASIMVEITEDEYLESATEIDDTIVQKLAIVKKMADGGMSSAEIEKFMKKEIANEYKNKSFQR